MGNELTSFFLFLFVTSSTFAFLDFVTTQVVGVQQASFPTSTYYDQDTYIFWQNLWTWWLVIILFGGVLFLLNYAQKRAPDEAGF